LPNVGDLIAEEIKTTEGQYVTAYEQAQGHRQTASLTVLNLRFPVSFGVHFITNFGSISPRIQAVRVTIQFVSPYAQLLWFSFFTSDVSCLFYSHM
jgi:hypothetical protein